MQRTKKITKIKTLINDINEKKEYHLCKPFYYHNGVDYFEDKEFKNNTTIERINAYAETQRIENNAENVITIIIRKNE